MCGIAGKTDWNSASLGRQEAVRKITAALKHRGPDADGQIDLEQISLGHRRLSIIDLSENASQPMSTADGRYHIVYNGEVYNFPELRKDLERNFNAEFKSRSDTEVILKCFVHYGTKCFAMFNGMFALAIWDNADRKLFLARDRFGKKPLYYHIDSRGDVTFASELTALLKDESIQFEVSAEALNCYLALGYILSPMSIAKGVFKLEPATFRCFDSIRQHPGIRYWDYSEAFRTKTSDRGEDIEQRIIHLLDESVKKRMISDVPVGAFLSGGIDSSSVVALMKKHHNGELHTFSVGFAEGSYNELPDAERTSQWIETVHHSLVCNPEGEHSVIALSVDAFDEPFADNSLVPMIEVSMLASQHVKVVLSGDGADEMFAGYITYKADKYHSIARPVPEFLKRLAIKALSGGLNGKKLNWKYKQRQFLNGSLHESDRAHYMWRQFFSPQERVAIMGKESEQLVYDTDPYNIFKRYYYMAEGMDKLDRNLYVDCMTWLPDDILVKVDRSTMRWGLEARSPYLDPELAEYAASIPSELKMNGFETKYILKKALRRILPEFVLEKKKSGFNAPVGKWMQTNGLDEFRAFNKYVYDRKLSQARKTV